MEKVLFVACCVGVVLIGAAMLACAVALLCSKAKKASIWSMPRFRMAVFSVCAIVATLAAQKSTPRLVYRSTRNSAAAITQPIVGEVGTCGGGRHSCLDGFVKRYMCQRTLRRTLFRSQMACLPIADA